MPLLDSYVSEKLQVGEINISWHYRVNNVSANCVLVYLQPLDCIYNQICDAHISNIMTKASCLHCVLLLFSQFGTHISLSSVIFMMYFVHFIC